MGEHSIVAATLLALYLFIAGGACGGAPCLAEYYFSFHEASEPYQVGSAEWNTVIERGTRSPEILAVLFFAGDFFDSGQEPLELYREDGTRVSMPRVYLERGSAISGLECGPHGQLNYSIGELPNGTYTVVHRLSSVTEFRLVPVIETDVVTAFDGVPALVATIILDR